MPNNVQLIVILLVVGFSFFNWLMKTLREQAKKNREIARRRAAEDDALRTGRVGSQSDGQGMSVGGGRGAVLSQPPDFEPPAPTLDTEANRLAELARKRQELIAELRRRQQGGQSAPPPPRPVAPPAPPQPAEVRRGQMMPTTRVAMPTRPKASVYAHATPQPKPQGIPAPKQRTAKAVRQEPGALDTGESTTHRMVLPEAAAMSAALTRGEPAIGGTGARSALGASLLPRMTTEELRRAVVLQEVLSTPVGMR